MENSIAQVHPELVSEWSTRNEDISPDKVTYGSNKLYWWIGPCGHEWQASAKARSHGEKCPICANERIVVGVNDLASQEPELAKEWSFKNKVTASMVGPGSHKKAIWKGKCGHEWTATIRNRVAGAGCPYCSHRALLSGFNDLETIFPEVAKEWSPRNLPLLPSQVTPFANKKVWWRCSKGHEWNTLISTRSGGSQCPYCSGIKLLKGFNDLKTMYPQLADEWSDKNGQLKADMVNERSTKNVWWKCSTCEYEWKAVIKARVRGLICPVCANRAVMAGYNDFSTTDPELMNEWDFQKNKIKPTQISRYAYKPVWWKCKHGHSWTDKICHRTIDRVGCRDCERDFLQNLPQLLVLLYAGRSNLKALLNDESIIGLPLDAYIPDLKLSFMFPYKKTDAEKRYMDVVTDLCNRQRIKCSIIYYANEGELCYNIKTSFRRAYTYLDSNSEEDIAYVRKQFYAMIERNAPKWL